MATTDATTDVPEAWREERLRALLKFDGEAYLKGHQDVYIQLPERGAFEVLYALYHRILDDKYDKQLQYVSGVANLKLADLVEQNQLPRKYIKKFLGSAVADKLIKKLHGIYEGSELIHKPLSGTTEPMDRK